MDHGNKTTFGVVLAVVGLIVGAAIAYPLGMSMANDDASTSTSQSTTSGNGTASDGVTVGGAKMVRTKDIVDNAVNANNVTTVVAAVKAADLVETLKSDGPFTVFAPNNDAFAALPDGTVDTLLLPENKDQLASILTYHVVAGTYTSADLKVMAQKGEGLKTVQGGMLYPVSEDNMIKIKDATGASYEIQTADVISSNGVTHVVTGVLMMQ